MALLILPNGSEAECLPANRQTFTADELTSIIGKCEIVGRTERNGTRITILADEDGQLKSLPYNKVGSRVAGKVLLGPVLCVTETELGLDSDEGDDDDPESEDFDG